MTAVQIPLLEILSSCDFIHCTIFNSCTDPNFFSPNCQATVPALSAEPTDFSTLRPLDDVAEQIRAAGTRIIYSYVFQPSDIYLYHEAIRCVRHVTLYT